jgi:hypothetical protein
MSDLPWPVLNGNNPLEWRTTCNPGVLETVSEWCVRQAKRCKTLTNRKDIDNTAGPSSSYRIRQWFADASRNITENRELPDFYVRIPRRIPTVKEQGVGRFGASGG